MIIKKINEFDNINNDLSNDDIFLVMNDPNGMKITKHVSLSQLLSVINGTTIYDIGDVVNNVAIDFDLHKQIQQLSLNGTAITLLKGSGWPTSSISRDVVLHIDVKTPTLINWNIVTEWYAQPPALTMPVGYHIVVFRSIGSTIMQGHYVGKRTA